MLCVCTRRVFVSLQYWSSKQCDWLSLAGPAPFPFPIFLFHDPIVHRFTHFSWFFKLSKCVNRIKSPPPKSVYGGGIRVLVFQIKTVKKAPPPPYSFCLTLCTRSKYTVNPLLPPAHPADQSIIVSNLTLKLTPSPPNYFNKILN